MNYSSLLVWRIQASDNVPTHNYIMFLTENYFINGTDLSRIQGRYP